LEGGPGERRHFLDWLVFHVKPDFRRFWTDYRRCLQQRNSLLRSDRIQPVDLTTWNLPLAAAGDRIDQMRCETLEWLVAEANVLLKECKFAADSILATTYESGWDTSQPLLRRLENDFYKDVNLGYTNAGPHRADIKFVFNRKPVAEVFSRGQLKTMITALYVAQIRVFQRYNPCNCILLIDDLPAELDEHSLQLLCGWLASTGNIQIFITSVDLRSTLSNWPSKDYKLFHVKQGQVTEEQAIGAST
jgi:DNA replication and repair protein RecF